MPLNIDLRGPCRFHLSLLLVFLLLPHCICGAKPVKKPKKVIDTKVPRDQKKSQEGNVPDLSGRGNVASSPVVVDALWQETLVALGSANATESLRLLRMCIVGGVEKPQAEKHLHSLLASFSREIIADRDLKNMKEIELTELMQLHRDICGLTISNSSDWLFLMQLSKAFSRPDNFIFSGQALLDRLEAGMPLLPDQAWPEILQSLEASLKKDEQVLYRLQLVKILASMEETAEKYRSALEDARLLAEAKAIKVLGLAEVAIAVGDFEVAKTHLDQVKAFDPGYSGLDVLYRKLELAGKIHKLLAKGSEELRNQKFAEAVNACNDVLKLDPGNIFARNLLQQIEEARGRVIGRSVSTDDRHALRLRRIEADLRKAEKEQDYQQIRLLIKEMLMIRSDLATFSERLEQVEQEIALSRLYADDRLREAEKLFSESDYSALRFFLNRNPGLMSSVERMIQVGEMRLLANFYTSYLEPAELKIAAEELQKKARQSFAASFVLMKLALADNNMTDARKHYQAARELNPQFAGLRWPGWLLWIHGEGRPVVVVFMIIVLFFLIKAIGPMFAWFESTYWLRTRILARIFPSLALRSLEGCFGTFKDNRDREKLFRMLIKCSIACGDKKKSARYAENLLELIPNDTAALDVLVPQWLAMADVSDERLAVMVGYAARSSDKPEVIEKTGQLIKRSRNISVEQIEFLKLYIGRFPEDLEMMQVIGKSLLEIPALEMPDSAIAMIEVAWRHTESDELWWSLWRLLMFCGRFDQAVQITREVMDKGKPVTPSALLEVYDRDIYADLRQVMSLLNLFDEKKVTEAARTVKRFRYFNPAMSSEILQILDGLCREGNADLVAAAREAADHVRARSRASAPVIEKMLAMQPVVFHQAGLAPDNSAADQHLPGADEVPVKECGTESGEISDQSVRDAGQAESALTGSSGDIDAEEPADEEGMTYTGSGSTKEVDNAAAAPVIAVPAEFDTQECAPAFSFAKINQTAADFEADDVISIGDLLANVSSPGARQEVYAAPPAEPLLTQTLPEISPENMGVSAVSQEPESEDKSMPLADSVFEPYEVKKEELIADSLPNDAEAVKIGEVRRRLFAELDSLQSPEMTSENWQDSLRRPADRSRLFAELD